MLEALVVNDLTFLTAFINRGELAPHHTISKRDRKCLEHTSVH